VRCFRNYVLDFVIVALQTAYRDSSQLVVVCRHRFHRCWIGWRMWTSVSATWQCLLVVCVASRCRVLSGPAQIRCRSLIPLRLYVTTLTMVLLGCRFPH